MRTEYHSKSDYFFTNKNLTYKGYKSNTILKYKIKKKKSRGLLYLTEKSQNDFMFPKHPFPHEMKVNIIIYLLHFLHLGNKM